MLQIEMVRDGHKNVACVVSGETETSGERVQVTDVSSMNPRPRALRLDAVEFAVEGGVKCFLRWQGTAHVLPLEGRGKLDLEWFGGLSGEEIHLETEGVGALFLVLDISKVGV
jgi:hypothetical protein